MKKMLIKHNKIKKKKLNHKHKRKEGVFNLDLKKFASFLLAVF